MALTVDRAAYREQGHEGTVLRQAVERRCRCTVEATDQLPRIYYCKLCLTRAAAIKRG